MSPFQSKMTFSDEKIIKIMFKYVLYLVAYVTWAHWASKKAITTHFHLTVT